MASSIIYQNADKTVTLIDIPRSIAAAQGTLQQPCLDHLVSVEPLETPFPSNEPKTEKARAKVLGNSTNQQLHDEYATLLRAALDETRAVFDGAWCLPRPFVNERPRQAKKRKLDGAADDEKIRAYLHDCSNELPSNVLGQPSNARTSSPEAWHATLQRRNLPGNDHHLESITTPHCVTNPSDSAAILELHQPHGEQPYAFRIPPRSAYYLSNTSESGPFRAAVRSHAAETASSKSFDFILLDPPWPNRSVKRTHRTPGATYATISTLDEVWNMLVGMDLDMLMANDCLVGVWITNSAAVRGLVLDEGGLFEEWGLTLVEEWVWLKTTSRGEPVTPPDAVWRKPYEVLLLGRRGQASNGSVSGPANVKRRVIAGVPDLHSRKPCLKALVESIFMSDKKDYRALEVFARYLVSGWWSWGNECLKFNWEGSWQLQKR